MAAPLVDKVAPFISHGKRVGIQIGQRAYSVGKSIGIRANRFMANLAETQRHNQAAAKGKKKDTRFVPPPVFGPTSSGYQPPDTSSIIGFRPPPPRQRR